MSFYKNDLFLTSQEVSCIAVCVCVCVCVCVLGLGDTENCKCDYCQRNILQLLQLLLKIF